MRLRVLALATLVFLVSTGCGDDDTAAGGGAGEDETSQAPAGTPDGEGDVSEADRFAIEQTMTEWLLEGRCELVTDEYLMTITFSDDESTDEACEQWTAGFSEPAYDADDIVYDNLEGEGDVVTIEIGDDFSNVTTVYELTFTDGRWKISGDEFNSDHL